MNIFTDNEAFRAIVESSIDAVVIINREGDIVFWNSAAELMFGYSETDVLGKYVHDILPTHDQREKADESFKKFQEVGTGPLVGKILQVKGLKKNGDIIDVQLSFNTVDIHGELFAYGFLRDISDMVARQENLEEQASIDGLTHTLNRRAFLEQSEKAFSFAKRHDSTLSVLMLDLDFFKEINDSFGHDAGDVALELFANKISSMLREEDLFGRIGGEEFCIVLPNSTVENSAIVAEKIRKEIEVQTISTAEKTLKISVSIGLSSLEEADSSIIEMQKRADSALYEAKRTGRNKVVVG
ncbi:hypothetical protein A9Q79_08280 [Methylophaga sp. 42_25_T18]|nr:hypothetical protein A9Q79_08280 [Methylophaga sp. 42_25_T18]